MYFKQLELVGFKSFPHKTKLKFEPGVTAVVGPNGCGKSNIADAIKWVLGEQSPKALRGSSMEDVIFNGTDTVDPINMAEVSLTFSNENRALPIDYNEVTLTRRLFRSGESEYLLNKTPVRLKDISSLLMGTGIGTSSYSVIEQGRIGLILSSRPEERRYIFEEASGITKYKAKKKEAIRKLEHTENNLVRINDIITEVKRQINSIERHAKKAEKYKSDFEIMKELDLKLTVYELRNINSALLASKGNLQTLCDNEKTHRLQLYEVTGSINQFRQDVDNAARALTDTQKELSDSTLFIDKSRHKIELNNERVNDLEHLAKTREKELSGFEERIRHEGEEITKINERLKEIVDKKEDKEKALSEKEKTSKELSRQIETHKGQIKDGKNRSVDLLASQTKIKNELIKLGADLANRKARQRRLDTEKAKVLEEKKSVESLLSGAENELKLSGDKVKDRERSLGELKNDLTFQENAFENTRKEELDKAAALNSLSSKEEILKEMIENFEGFDNSVKIVMDGAKNGTLKGVIGVVADMLEPENGYELALELSLGKKAQGIVVDNKDIIASAVSYPGNNKGRARFIIYEDFKNFAKSSRLAAIAKKENLSPLSEHVRIDEAYRALADYLLKDTYLVEDIQKAYGLYNKYGENIKFVTKEGALLERGFISIELTRDIQTTSIIGRAKRLEGIANEKEKISREIESLKAEGAKKKESIDSLREKIDTEEKDLKKEEIDFANALSKKESIEANWKKINDEFSVIELELNEAAELINEISLKGTELNTKLNENENEYSNLEDFINSAEKAAQDKTESMNKLLFEASEIRSELGFLRNTETQEARNLEKETNLLKELVAQYEERKSSAAASEERIKILEKEAESLKLEIREKEAEELGVKEKLSALSEKREMLLRELNKKETIVREKEALVENLKDQMRNFEIKAKENEFSLANIKSRIQQAYKVDAQSVNVEIEEGTDWEDVRNQVEILRIKLDKLGPVNLVAIEEHKELEERYAFLTQQQEDLLRAKDSLHKAIIKINKTTKVLFVETFEKIQLEFRNYFRMLFGGGHAEVFLLDETDVLESGIEIVARPPGKKLQNLMLLSGGEKALTAIALLFAVFKVKPSPFCILDEVDAPLDESNIGRFTRILQEFLKTSQFIIVTHNKKTMQMADILYGITMQQKGVSKIVSVKFADEKDKSDEKEKVLV